MINFYKNDFLNNNKETKKFFYDEQKTYISDIYLSCQISYPSLLICFCLKENSTKISALKFNIKNNFEKESDSQEFYDDRFKKLIGIRSAEPSETNEILVGYFGSFFTSTIIHFYIIYYKIDYNKFNKFLIEAHNNIVYCNYFEVYHFKNQNNYTFTCHFN